jgi:aminoglycoside phosphotransferase (APT) family kinase protein/uridine kinase
MRDANPPIDLMNPQSWPQREMPIKVLAIDGHGGSGKSTLAEILASKLGAEIIRTDDFASWDNPLNWWPLLIEYVFEPISKGSRTLSYPRSKWWADHHPVPVVDQPVTEIMILEGVTSLRKEFGAYISYGIFVDTPKEICLQRGLARDAGMDGKTDAEIEAMWIAWIAQEDGYIAGDNPKAHANKIVDGSRPFSGQIAASSGIGARDIDASLAARLVASQFPQWRDLPIAPVEVTGWDNRTFRLGTELSIRLPSAEAYVAQVEKEHRWLPTLAPQLPLPIPDPLAMGRPAEGYPWNWSIYRWIEGTVASTENVSDMEEFACTLARFLTRLWQIDPAGGPPPGQHNFFRGGPLATYDSDTRSALASLGDAIPFDTASVVWETALESKWRGSPVWFHGDVSAGNLLVGGGRLRALIDFGSSGVGDPACDLAIAWTFLSGGSRDAFRRTVQVDADTWARGRGWALWKALITVADRVTYGQGEAASARRVITEILGDHHP